MEITLFKTFDDPYRESMTQYAACLERALRAKLNPAESVKSFFPSFAVKTPKLARHLSQYVGYQIAANFNQTDINHIVDHSYAHLLHSMDGSTTIITLHDMIWAKVRQGNYDERVLPLNFIQRFNLSGLAKAAAIVCDSDATWKALRNYSPRAADKAVVIPPGLNEIFDQASSKFSAQDLLKGIPKPFIFHPGHTQSYKNIPALFYVLAEVRKAGEPIRLVKTGTPFTPEQISLSERLGVKSFIHHLGKVPSEALPEIYQSADILLLPSLDEGFGFPALEAMHCGLPVVAANRGSLPELVRDAGVLVEPNDYEGMTKSILSLLRAPAIRAAFIERGRKRAAEFTWERTARELMKLYRRLYYKKEGIEF